MALLSEAITYICTYTFRICTGCSDGRVILYVAQKTKVLLNLGAREIYHAAAIHYTGCSMDITVRFNLGVRYELKRFCIEEIPGNKDEGKIKRYCVHSKKP
jgi:hypothetical protein